MLRRSIPVQLLDLSGSGCQLGAGREVEVGATGELQLSMGNQEYRDVVRVVRLMGRHGSHRACALGGMFGWAAPSDATSLRIAVPMPPAEPEVEPGVAMEAG